MTFAPQTALAALRHEARARWEMRRAGWRAATAMSLIAAALAATPAAASVYVPHPYVPGHGEPIRWDNLPPVIELVQYLDQSPDGPGAPGRKPVRHCWYNEFGPGIQFLGSGKCPVALVVPTDPETPELPEEPSPVPLPASLPLLLAALAGLGLIRRKRP